MVSIEIIIWSRKRLIRLFVVKVTLSADSTAVTQVNTVPPTDRWRWGRLRTFRSITPVAIIILFIEIIILIQVSIAV